MVLRFVEIIFCAAIEAAILILLSRVLFNAFNKGIKNSVISGILSVLFADFISYYGSVAFFEIENVIMGYGFYTPRLNVYSIPVIGRIISICDALHDFFTYTIGGFSWYAYNGMTFGYIGYALSDIIDVLLEVALFVLVIVLLVRYCTKDKKVNTTENNSSYQQANTQRTYKRQATIEELDQLKKYKELLDNGGLTQEEYDKKKKEILGL